MPFQRYLPDRELAIWLLLFLLFAALSGCAAYVGTDDNNRAARIVISSFGIVLGPFVGALNRGFQSCCVEFSVYLLPWGAIPLALGVGLHLWKRPSSAVFRLVFWTIGWLAWFATGLLSFAHALS